MKAVLRSVKPYWLYLILTGKKTIEVGKSCPRAKDWNKVVEMYCSKDMRSFNRIPEEDKEWMRKYLGKVIGEFVCGKVTPLVPLGLRGFEVLDETLKAMCLTTDDLNVYGGLKTLYGWHISQLKIYDKPKPLDEFYIRCRISDKKCRLCDNCFEREDSYGRYYAVKKLTRPPQSWCYVQELEDSNDKQRVA